MGRIMKVRILQAVCFFNCALAASVAVADAPLRPGDQIEMKVGGVPTTENSVLSGAYTVNGDGSVNLPYIGRVKVAGLSPGAAESAIENAYKSRDIYTNPNVVITMQAQSRFVSVGGQVKTPQRVPFTPDLTIMSSINAAGGLSQFANERKVRLLRDSQVMIIDLNRIQANSSLDPQVQPGDRIEVPSLFVGSKNAPDRSNEPQQNADVNRGPGFETQLKEAQDKLQQAQVIAGQASGENAALETQLKQTQDQLKQTQEKADLTSSQCATLKARLKESQDQLQQVERNANLIFNQRAALEAELKEAQDKLQRARRNAEQASRQQDQLKAQLKEAQDQLQQTQQNADRATSRRAVATVKDDNEQGAKQLNSGKTLPLEP
jgi:protein involved in polysaccharide export with SLBB domain